MNCFLCNDNICDKNDSKEHIFLNCIGGRKTVNNYICKTCNSKTGEEWDSEVDKCLSSLALIFKIKRHRGKVQSKKIVADDGIEYFIHLNRISSDKLEHEIKDNQLIIKGPSRKRIEQYKNKLVKEGAFIGEIEEGNFHTENEQQRISHRQKFNISPCDSNFSKSLVKSSIALLASESFCIKNYNLARNYLIGEGECCVEYAFDSDLIGDRPFGKPFHYIRIFSDGNMVYAYFEIYGFIRYMISLSDQYSGECILLTYAFDPSEGESFDIHCDGIEKVEKQHPAYLQKRIIDEFYFVRGFDGAFLSNINDVEDDFCLENFDAFYKLFTEPAVKFSVENLKNIDRVNSAKSYIDKSICNLTKNVIQYIKYNKAIKSDS